MKFSEIKKFPRCNYLVSVAWTSLEHQIKWMKEDYDADFDPDFQRGNVWTEEQQIKYCEYIIKGGTSGRDLYFNCPGWERMSIDGKFVLVDGKQRINAVLSFLNNKIKVFGCYYKDYEDRLRPVDCSFNWHIAAIESRSELLEWYLDFNSGGTIHSPEEIERVKLLLEKELSMIVHS